MFRRGTTFAIWASVLGCGNPSSLTDSVPSEGVRIISLHDTTTEMVVALGESHALVAITTPAHLSERATLTVAEVATLPVGPMDVESLLAQHPTLVLGTDVVIERQPHLARALSSAQVESVWIDPSSSEEIFATYLDIAQRIGAADVAAEHIEALRAQAPEARASALDDPVRVFVYDCCEPPFTTGARSPLNEILEGLGARNIFDDLPQDWGNVSWEAVATRSPELIVIHEYVWAEQSDVDTKRALLESLPFLRDVPAIRHRAFETLPLGVALEGLRVFEAWDLLEPSITACRERRSGRGAHR